MKHGGNCKHLKRIALPTIFDESVEGRIIHVLNGTTNVGQYNIVVLNRGEKHGLDVGHVLSVWQAGRMINDRFSSGVNGSKVQLPDEKAGTLMIFKTYNRISYALVMEATSEIHILDKVKDPV